MSDEQDDRVGYRRPAQGAPIWRSQFRQPEGSAGGLEKHQDLGPPDRPRAAGGAGKRAAGHAQQRRTPLQDLATEGPERLRSGHQAVRSLSRQPRSRRRRSTSGPSSFCRSRDWGDIAERRSEGRAARGWSTSGPRRRPINERSAASKWRRWTLARERASVSVTGDNLRRRPCPGASLPRAFGQYRPRFPRCRRPKGETPCRAARDRREYERDRFEALGALRDPQRVRAVRESGQWRAIEEQRRERQAIRARQERRDEAFRDQRQELRKEAEATERRQERREEAEPPNVDRSAARRPRPPNVGRRSCSSSGAMSGRKRSGRMSVRRSGHAKSATRNAKRRLAARSVARRSKPQNAGRSGSRDSGARSERKRSGPRSSSAPG